MKKFLSTVLAAALVLAMVIPAKAANIDLQTKFGDDVKIASLEDSSGAHQIKIDLTSTGLKPEEVCGAKLTVKVTDLSSGLGGALAASAESFGWWKSISEWGNDGSDKPVILTPTGKADEYTLTFKGTEAYFAASDSNAFSLVVQAYWGKNIDELNQIDILDKDGKVIYTTVPKAEETVPPVNPPKTADVSPVAVVVISAVCLLLCLAASRKKEA